MGGDKNSSEQIEELRESSAREARELLDRVENLSEEEADLLDRAESGVSRHKVEEELGELKKVLRNKVAPGLEELEGKVEKLREGVEPGNGDGKFLETIDHVVEGLEQERERFDALFQNLEDQLERGMEPEYAVINLGDFIRDEEDRLNRIDREINRLETHS